MSLSRTIAYNTLLQIGAKIIVTILAVVAFGLMTRYLGTEGFGAYTTITAFLQFFGILVDMGLSVIAIQLMAEVGHDHKKNFDNIFTLRLLAGIIIYGIAPFVALLLPYSADVKLGILLMAPSFFVSSLIQLSTAPYQTNLKMMVPTIADIVSKVVLIAGIVGVIGVGGTLSDILLVILLNNAVQWMILFWYARDWHRVLAFDWIVWRAVWCRTWPIALSILCNVVYLRADTLILSLFKSQTEVGLYGAAFRVLEVMMTLPIMFIGLTLASFARAWSSDDRVSFTRYFQKSFDVMALAAFPLIVGTWFVGSDLMILITGPSFAESGALLKLLIVAVGALFFGSLFGHLINIINEQRRMLFGYACVAAISIGAYLTFIPTYSYWAAATITIATEILVALIGFAVFYHKTRIAPALTTTYAAGFSSAVMGVFLYAFPGVPLGVKIIGGTTVYIITLCLTGGLSRELVASLLPVKRQ